MHDWVFGSDDWQSIAMYNEHGQNRYSQIPPGIVVSLPRKIIKQGVVEVIDGISLDDEISSRMIKKTVDELLNDRQYIEHLLV